MLGCNGFKCFNILVTCYAGALKASGSKSLGISVFCSARVLRASCFGLECIAIVVLHLVLRIPHKAAQHGSLNEEGSELANAERDKVCFGQLRRGFGRVHLR